MFRVIHFEIHAEKPERAAKFYTDVFGWEVKQWGNNPYWMCMTGKNEEATGIKGKWGGIDGGLLIRKGGAPVEGAAVNAFVCTMDVPNVDETVKKVLAGGGSIALPAADMPAIGRLAYCKDTEGNIFGLITPLPMDQQGKAA